MTRSMLGTVTALALTLAAGLIAGNASAEPALTKEECQQAGRVAKDVYEMAKKNKREYPTDAEAKNAGKKAYIRRINGELSDENAKDLDWTEALERCRKLDANGTKEIETLLS